VKNTGQKQFINFLLNEFGKALNSNNTIWPWFLVGAFLLIKQFSFIESALFWIQSNENESVSSHYFYVDISQ
jgi:hypothetical protein